MKHCEEISRCFFVCRATPIKSKGFSLGYKAQTAPIATALSVTFVLGKSIITKARQRKC